ncbi:MAG: hypothetical protein KIT84_13730 [Labilithrix sp.]|nr:hypothetical protein [Labilithrix sp.]MCW5812079.1 hypothetical protein [Labilithrix sp.]
MSGTRKMEKFEVDAYVKAHDAAADPDADLPARPFEPRTPDPPAPPPPPADANTLEHVLASAAAEARAASESLGSAAARLQEEAPAPAPAPLRPDQLPTPVASWVPAEASLPEAPADASAEQTPTTPDALRTRLARKFVSLADSVTEAFKDFVIGAGMWSIELTVPQGMSTGGGKQALQHIRLNPKRQGYNVFVAGTVNQVEKRADLRDFDHVAIMHEVRHRSALEISPQEWEQFLRKAEVVLNGAGIQSMRTPPPRELLEQRRSAQRVSKGAIVALVVVALLALIVIWRVVLALRTGV